MRTLDKVKKSLPASWYFDPDHYARELDAIWYRDWVCVGRLESISRAGDFFVAAIGDQSIIVTRDQNGEVRAFYNTCRHRGSLLCKEATGQFRNGRIICPYHTWTYSTKGELLSTPGRFETEDFNAGDYSLYPVHTDAWGGFVFVNLASTPECGLLEFMGIEASYLENWPLEQLRSVHQEIKTVACNWKIFWENYSECYHCPRIHPELCKVMPVYKKAVFDHADLPGWKPAYDGDTGRGSVGGGARTWTLDGQLAFPPMEGLSEREIERGVEFATVTGSFYAVGHPDYVRSVRIVPTGPESVELVIDWLLPESVTDPDPQKLASIQDLALLVIDQDSEVCELNQQGLRSHPHREGMLVPQEYELWDFHEWLRSRLRPIMSN